MICSNMFEPILNMFQHVQRDSSCLASVLSICWTTVPRGPVQPLTLPSLGREVLGVHPTYS